MIGIVKRPCLGIVLDKAGKPCGTRRLNPDEWGHITLEHGETPGKRELVMLSDGKHELLQHVLVWSHDIKLQYDPFNETEWSAL